jgi:hypothetical protein
MLLSRYIIWKYLYLKIKIAEGRLICTCASVQSEGGYQIQGNIFSAGHGIDSGGVSILSNATKYILGIKLGDFKRNLVKIQSFSIYCSSSGGAIVEVFKIFSPASNPITAPTFNPVDPNSCVEFDIAGTAVSLTNAVLIYRTYIAEAANINYDNFTDISGPIYLTAGVDVSPNFYSDYIVVRLKNISNQTETFYASFNWIEL